MQKSNKVIPKAKKARSTSCAQCLNYEWEIHDLKDKLRALRPIKTLAEALDAVYRNNSWRDKEDIW